MAERDIELGLLDLYLHPGKFYVTSDVGSCGDCGGYVSSGAYAWCGPCLYKRIAARLRASTPEGSETDMRVRMSMVLAEAIAVFVGQGECDLQIPNDGHRFDGYVRRLVEIAQPAPTEEQERATQREGGEG